MTPRSANILVTGGAGFIGSNFIRFVFEKTDFRGSIVNYDKLTYAGNLLNLADIEKKLGGHRYFFERGDILDYEKVRNVVSKFNINIIVHFAAESHVDRSIFGPKEFVETNINGTFNLLEVSRQQWTGRSDVRFHHISTDEVYGSLGDTGYFFETTSYDPRSPYSASKAASDHLVRAYYHTYGLPISISNCSNNYGPRQFPEKLIPLLILKALAGEPLPIYGDGLNVRDWLYVEDHCEALRRVLVHGCVGEVYNIGGNCEKTNLDVVTTVCRLLDEMAPNSPYRPHDRLIRFVKDRPGHDRRYAMDASKIREDLGWEPRHSLEQGLRLTVEWFLSHPEWTRAIREQEGYQRWMSRQYGGEQES